MEISLGETLRYKLCSTVQVGRKAYVDQTRAASTDFSMGGDGSPPIGGGPKGGDKGPMGGGISA